MSAKPKKNETGHFHGLPLVVALILVILGCVLATQYAAHSLAYQPALGDPLFTLGSFPIYQPMGWLTWYFKFGSVEHPAITQTFTRAPMFAIGGLIAGAIAAAAIRYYTTRDLQEAMPTLHGSAHWMPREEVLKSGLVGSGKGVYIGAWTDPKTGTTEYLRHDGAEHILAMAPTRSGKGVGLVLPTLYSWPHSVVVHDIKGEAWALTSGWRQAEANNHVLRFDPADPTGTGAHFNPCDEIRLRTINEVGDVQNIASMIVDPDGKGLNDHWAKTGHALLVGAMLHVLYAEHDKTLRGVGDFLSDPSRSFEDTLYIMLKTEHDPDGSAAWTTSSGEATRVHPVVAASARDMLNKAENERSGVLSTAMSFLTLYRDPVIAANTCDSHFRIDDLMNAEKPVSLYLVVRPSDKDRLKPLVRLIMNQIVRLLTKDMQFKAGRSVENYKHRLLLLIDEFPALGKLEIFEEALAFIAGYGLKAYLIIQDKSQLEKHYGRDENVTGNCHIKVAYAPGKVETAEALSKMLGRQTIVQQKVSYSGTRTKSSLGQISSQTSETGRDLLSPDELMRLRGPSKVGNDIVDAGEMIIFTAGRPPILGTQILYFTDPTFSRRSQIEAPGSSDRVRLAPPPAAPLPRPPMPDSLDGEGLDAAAGTPDDEGYDDAAQWSHPPLDEAAEIHDPEELPFAAFEGDPTFTTDEDDPPLGAPLVLDESDRLPPGAELDAEGEDEPEMEAADLDIVALSKQWAAGVDVEQLPELGAHLAPADTSAVPEETSTDVLAASIRWAGGHGLHELPPLREGEANEDASASAGDATDDGGAAEEDPFALMNAMASKR